MNQEMLNEPKIMKQQSENLQITDAQELVPILEDIKITDEDGNNWWNSRQLSHALGYGKYWNFEHLLQKVSTFLQKEKGYNLNEHIREISEMVPVGAGVRQVKSSLLSHVVCNAIVLNADKRKPMVKVAIDYFGNQLSAEEQSRGITGNVLIYKTSEGKTEVAVLYSHDTFWLSQQRMASLFGVDVSTINYHIQELVRSEELNMSEIVRKIPIISETLTTKDTYIYNLDAVIAIGFRVNSYEATQFRIWARNTLKEYMVKGFAINDERLKGKDPLGADYFEELLDRIRDIRASERRYYQKITDIYATSCDYDVHAQTTKDFFAMVQNMMHYAVTHQTAAEIVYQRTDAQKPYMGLTTWKTAPKGLIQRSDVTIAKNYLSEQELESLNLLSSAFIDMAELKAEKHQLMYMKDWGELLIKLLKMEDCDILQHKGAISQESASEKAIQEFEKYRILQDRMFESDFDKFAGLLPFEEE